MKSLQGRRHVMFADEELTVRLRDVLAGDTLK
jgi:hypothetical protein